MAGVLDNINTAYTTIADLNVWFKLKGGQDLSLTDFPEIIPFRWEYFRDNWEFIKQKYVDRIPQYQDPDLLKTQITNLSSFIDAQRNSKNNPFRKRSALFQFFAIFDETSTADVPLTTEESRLIQNKITEVTSYKRDDFVKIRSTLEVLRDQYADIRNLQDEQYNDTFNRGSVAGQTDATNFDMNQLKGINDSIKTINFILANQFSLNQSFVDPYAQARANANNPEIEILNYESGFLVNMPYGQDLRGLAKNYLGDEDRWIEIAIANGLKPPYIDEIGEKIELIANASGNKITIAGIATNGSLNSDKIFTNQVLYLSSSVYTFPEQRVIINIEEIPVSGDLVIELDGEPNLEKYRIDDNASIRIYKPQTINSNLKILIPSNQPNPDNRKDITPWFLTASPEDAKRMKIDLRLDENGEINFDNTADLELSYGYDNAIQAIRLKMQVELGELARHNNFGLTNITGKNNTDINSLQQVLAESISDQVGLDARFDRIESLNINYSVTDEDKESAAGFNVQMVVRLAGSSQTIPISFKINT